jgi:hypothetical protein
MTIFIPLKYKTCKFLCRYHPIARHSAYFGEGNGNISLDKVQCTGKERDLLACHHENADNSNSSHSNDAGVSCKINFNEIVVFVKVHLLYKPATSECINLQLM